MIWAPMVPSLWNTSGKRTGSASFEIAHFLTHTTVKFAPEDLSLFGTC